MALGRIGDRRAVQPLLKAGSDKDDPFLRHAIVYALYEIGDRKLPADNSLAAQVRRMHKVDKRGPPKHVMPEIQLADVAKPDPKKDATQRARLEKLADFLPKGDPVRGAKLFSNPGKTLCITCHVMGDRGAAFGPDLTKIGAIRSKRDLLEAIVYPSSSIARYYKLVIAQTANGQKAGLLVKDTVDTMVLASAPGAEQAIPIKNVKSAKYSNMSVMPEVFDPLLKPQEISDLVAFLKQAQ
jgi:putative heme-binding domain-containing protein